MTQIQTNKQSSVQDTRNWVAIDIMGGDHGLPMVLSACKLALELQPSLCLYLVGDQAIIQNSLATYGLDQHSASLKLIPASESIAMDEPPIHAMRHRKDSSIHVMASLVAKGQANSCVSAGNTGALVAITKNILKTLPGITRPGLMALVPTKNKTHARMIDLGANLNLTANQYVQFAVMAATIATHIDQIALPSVGLLNVGIEAMKGNANVKEVNAALEQAAKSGIFCYVGFVEGGDIFTGKIDIVLCDGFVGNIALKVAEGTASLISGFTREQFTSNFWRKIIGFCAKPIFADIKYYLDPASRNGANLLGLNGVVIKSHGSANVNAFVAAINMASQQGQMCLTALLAQQLRNFYQLTDNGSSDKVS